MKKKSMSPSGYGYKYTNRGGRKTLRMPPNK